MKLPRKRRPFVAILPMVACLGVLLSLVSPGVSLLGGLFLAIFGTALFHLALRWDAQGLAIFSSLFGILWLAISADLILGSDVGTGEDWRSVPSYFAGFTILELPALLACDFFVLLRGRMSFAEWKQDGMVYLAWVLAAVLSGYVGQFAVDVGGTPMWNPWIAWPVALVAFSTPLVASLRVTRRLWTHPNPLPQST
jgi:hypothetical protein